MTLSTKEEKTIEGRLNRRIADPHSFTVFEIISLDDVLHFSDEDLLLLVRG